jgi:hypothetical protein
VLDPTDWPAGMTILATGSSTVLDGQAVTPVAVAADPAVDASDDPPPGEADGS